MAFLSAWDQQRAAEKAEFGARSNSDYSYEKLLAKEAAKVAHTKEMRDRDFYTQKPRNWSNAEWYTYNLPAHHLKGVPSDYSMAVQTGENMHMRHRKGKQPEATKDSIEDTDAWKPDAEENEFEKEVKDEENPDVGTYSHLANANDADPRIKHDGLSKKDKRVEKALHEAANEDYKDQEVTSKILAHKHHKKDGQSILDKEIAVVDGKANKDGKKPEAVVAETQKDEKPEKVAPAAPKAHSQKASDSK